MEHQPSGQAALVQLAVKVVERASLYGRGHKVLAGGHADQECERELEKEEEEEEEVEKEVQCSSRQGEGGGV